jgi:hypothetical protein
VPFTCPWACANKNTGRVKKYPKSSAFLMVFVPPFPLHR